MALQYTVVKVTRSKEIGPQLVVQDSASGKVAYPADMTQALQMADALNTTLLHPDAVAWDGKPAAI